MKAYHIKDWDYYESAETRKYSELIWFKSKNKIVGEGFGHTLSQPGEKGPFLYGMWKIVELIAAGSRKGERGWLIRNGSPLDDQRMANLMRLPTSFFTETIRFFSTAPMDWLELREFPGCGQDATGRTPGESPGNLPPTATGQDATGRTPGEILSTYEHTNIRSKNIRSTEEEEDGGTSSPPCPEQPSDAMVFEFAQFWPGEPASGAPAMPKEFVADWLSKMTGRTVGWPADWERKLVADWRCRFRTWKPQLATVPQSIQQRVQLAAAQARIKELEAVLEEERSEEQVVQLKKYRRVAREIQKKQAAGDFAPVLEGAGV